MDGPPNRILPDPLAQPHNQTEPGGAWRVSRPVTYFGAALLVAAAALARMALLPELASGFPFLTFYPTVIFAAYLFGAKPALLNAVLGLLVAWYFFIATDNIFALGMEAPVAMMFYLIVSILLIGVMHTMQLANARLRLERDNSERLAENRELLFRELQHRVGNSLQLVSSVLALQRRKLAEPEAIDAIDEASRRVALIGRVQRQLHDPSGAPLALVGFLSGICADLLDAGGKPGITFRVAGNDDALLPADLAIPTALVVAEAVFNAIEHGFRNRDEGTIGIVVSVADNRLTIVVEDDGAGLPEGFDFNRSQSLGLRISHKLASYHGGSFSLQRNGEVTVARIELPLPG